MIASNATPKTRPIASEAKQPVSIFLVIHTLLHHSHRLPKPLTAETLVKAVGEGGILHYSIFLPIFIFNLYKKLFQLNLNRFPSKIV